MTAHPVVINVVSTMVLADGTVTVQLHSGRLGAEQSPPVCYRGGTIGDAEDSISQAVQDMVKRLRLQVGEVVRSSQAPREVMVAPPVPFEDPCPRCNNLRRVLDTGGTDDRVKRCPVCRPRGGGS